MKLRLILLFVFFSSLGAEEPHFYLTSQVDVSKKFVERVDVEKKSIRLASHRLSDVAIIKSLIKAHQRNVSIEVLVDSVTVTKQTPLALLVKEGIPVFVWLSDSFPKKKSQAPKRMRHGYCVFGSDLLWSGSYSFSLTSKFQHFENALLVRDATASRAFLLEFEEMKVKHTTPFSLYFEQKGFAL